MKGICLAVCISLLGSASAWAEESANPVTVSLAGLTCKEMMSGQDVDRAAVLAFFHGYDAGKRSEKTVDVTAMSALSDRVTDYCLSNPTSSVMDAFAKASL
jgi:hypothetical protein